MPPVDPDKYYGYANHDYATHETQIATVKVEHHFTPTATLRNTLRLANYKRSVEATISTVAATDRLGRPVTPATPSPTSPASASTSA
jgi:outer membrane receptor for monomeric catechols